MPITPIHKIAKIILVTKALLRNGDKYLIIRRTANDQFDGGQWDLPGGKMEQNESIKQSIMFEIKEETGIAVNENDISNLAAFYDHASEYHKYKDYWYVLMCCEVTTGQTQVTLSEEHSEYKWVAAEELPKYLVRPAFIKVVNYIFERKKR